MGDVTSAVAEGVDAVAVGETTKISVLQLC